MPDILSESDIADYADRLTTESAFTLRDSEYKWRRSLLFQQEGADPVQSRNTPARPGAHSQFRSPEIEDDTHSFKNRILAAPVKVNIAAVSASDRASGRAQKQENFSYRHYYRWRDQGVFDSPLFDMASLGIGWTHLRLNTKALPLIPDFAGDDTEKYIEEADARIKAFIEKEQGDLFELEPIDAMAMYYPPDKANMVYRATLPLVPLVKEYASRGVQIGYETSGELVVTTLSPGQNPYIDPTWWTKTVDLVIVETDDYCYHLVTNGKKEGTKQLAVYKNYLGRPGFTYTYGERTGSRDPLLEFRPLVMGKYPLVPIKNKLVQGFVNAGEDAMMMRYALKPIANTLMPPSEGALEITVTSEGILVPPDGYEIVSPKLELGVDVEKGIQLLETLDTYGYPKSLNRPEEVQASSGYDRARQQDAVASLLNPPLQHFAAMLSGVFGMMGHGVREIDLPVSVQNIYSKDGERTVSEKVTLSPTDVVDADINVDFSSITIFNRIAAEEQGRLLMQADLMTETEFLTNVRGIDDVDAFRKQRMKDKVRKAMEDAAVATVITIQQQIATDVVDEALAETAVQPIVPTTGDRDRADRGPSMPIGPGQGMPLEPTPPGMAEQGAPVQAGVV